MRPLIVSPTYQEAENIDEFLRHGAQRRCPTPTSSSSTTTAPTAPPTRPRRSRAELGNIEVLRRPKKIGLGDAYRAGFSVGIERGYDVLVQIDADLSHDPERAPRRSSSDIERRRRRGHRLALRPRRLDPELAVAAARDVEVGQPLHVVRARHADQGRDVGLSRVPRRHAEEGRLRQHPRQGLRLPDGARVPRAPRRAAASSRSRSRSPTACAASRSSRSRVAAEELTLVTLVGRPRPRRPPRPLTRNPRFQRTCGIRCLRDVAQFGLSGWSRLRRCVLRGTRPRRSPTRCRGARRRCSRPRASR